MGTDDADADTSTIDALLERYLHLLHEYTALREQLGALQAGVYQGLARANFAAERGMRYGPDHYDDRMQASRRVRITMAGTGTTTVAAPSFAVLREEEEEGDTKHPHPQHDHVTTEKEGEKEKEEKREEGKIDDSEANKTGEPASHNEEEGTAPAAQKRDRDPLRWFGLLTPMALRQAQAQSIQAVEQTIPRLVSVDAEMAQVEIEVRRARKRRAKAQAAAAKLKEQQQQQQQPQQQGAVTTSSNEVVV